MILWGKDLISLEFLQERTCFGLSFYMKSKNIVLFSFTIDFFLIQEEKLVVVVAVLLFYFHGKHLRSCRDGQLT